MELGSILHFLENKTILVTGATGFLAKIFLEKILRVQPNVKKFYLLLRAADSESATQRLHNDIVGKELFKVLRERYGASGLHSLVSEKVTSVPGDISCEDLGVKDSSLRLKMFRELDMVLNFAATTNFDERYDVALGINTMGAFHVLNFAKKCVKIKMLVHVSTAYVCGEDSGLIPEKPFLMGQAKKGSNQVDINKETKLAQEKLQSLQLLGATEKAIASSMKDFGIERARFYGWPNTYVFTKAMGEMLLAQLKYDLPLLIIRPTMVASTYSDPFPGWIEGVRTIDSVIVGYAKGKMTCFISSPRLTLDVIPADMVVNAIIVAMVAHANYQSLDMIYHLGSSFRNPVKFSNIQDFTFRFFTKEPWFNKDGKAVKIGKATIFSSMTSFRLYIAIRFLLPLKALHLVNIMLFQKYQDLCIVLDRKIKFVMRLVDLYQPYLFFEGIFDDTNSEKLLIAARETSPDAKAFNFDPMSINWEDYMMGAHIPGLVKYVMK